MIYLNAFIVGGLICVIGQLILDFFKKTPGHITAYFVIAGAILDSFNIYDKIVEFAGAGAMVPITSFGHLMAHSALIEANKTGILGIGLGMFSVTATGITASILFAFIMALIFKPKG